VAETNTPPRRAEPKEKPTGIGAVLHKIKVAIAVLIGSLILSLIIEWIGIAFIWPEQGFRHSQKMLETEMSWLATDFTRSMLHSNPVQTGERFISAAYEMLFVKSGFMDFVREARSSSPQACGWRHESYALFRWLENYLLATVYVTLTFLVRLIILTLTLPLFALAALTGLVDGLVRRDLRRFGAGRESGFVYHHAKRTIGPLFFSAWIIYLSLPFSLHPNWVLLPCAVLLGLAISITAGSFKKYI
jgi:integrating conjugative element membrane protein (TIGR03747 family)